MYVVAHDGEGVDFDLMFLFVFDHVGCQFFDVFINDKGKAVVLGFECDVVDFTGLFDVDGVGHRNISFSSIELLCGVPISTAKKV